MAEDVGSLVVRVAMENSSFQQGVQNLNRSLKVIQSEFKNATSGLKEHDKGLDILKAKQEMLSKSIDIQSKLVKEYKDKLKESKETLGKNAEAQEKLKSKVEDAKKAYEDTKKTLGENAEKTKELKEDYEKLSKEYEQNEEKLRNNVRTIDNWTVRVNNAQAQLSQMESELQQTNRQINQQTSNWNRLSNALAKVGKALDGISKKMGEVGKNATAKITAPIAGIATAVSKLGMEFEASVSNISALSGATGDDLKELESKAREMGAATSKSAKDAADAMGYMALAGWKQKEIIGGIEPVLRLAEAGNIDLARASALTTDSLSSLGLTVQDLPHYLDLVAQTARSSNTDIDQMTEAYIKVGGVLKGLNVPLEESAVILGMLANKGIKGSEAGTALNAVMTNLTAPTGRAKDALETLNLSAFDGDGKFKGLANVLMELKEKTQGMTEEQRNLTLSMVGGKEHVKDLNALLSGLDTDYTKLTSAIGQADGALNDMATTMQNNNKGSITALKSAIEELGLKLYDVLKPSIAAIVDKLQEFTDKLNSLNPATVESIVKVAGLAAAIGPVLWIGSKLIGIIGSIVTAFSTVAGAIGVVTTGAVAATPAIGTLAGVFTVLTGPVGIAIAAIAALTAGGIALYNHFSKASLETQKFGKDVSEATQKAIVAYEELDNNVGQALMNMKVRNEKVSKEAADAITSNFAGMSNQITTKMNENFNADYETINNFMIKSGALRDEDSKQILDNMQKHHDFEVQTVQQGQARINEIMQSASQEKRQITTEEWNEINTIRDNMMTDAITVMSQSEAEQKSLLERQKHNASITTAEQAAEVAKNSAEQRDKVIADAEEQYDKTVQAIIKQRDETGTISAEQANSLIEAAKHQKEITVNQAQGMHEEIIMEAQNQAKEHADKVDWETGEVKSKWQVMCDTVSNKAKELKDTTVNAFTEKANSISNKCSEIKKDISNKWNEILNFFSTLPSKLKAKGLEMFESMKQGIKSKLESIKGAATEIGEGIVEAVKNIPSRMISIGRDIAQGLANGIKKFANSAFEAAKDLGRGVADATKGILDIHSPSRVMMELGQYTSQGLAQGILKDKDKIEQATKLATGTIKDIASGQLIGLEIKSNVSNKDISSNAKNILNWGENNKKAYQDYVNFVGKLNQDEVKKTKEALDMEYKNKIKNLDDRIKSLKTHSKNKNKIEIQGLEESKKVLKQYNDLAVNLLNKRSEEVKKSLKVSENTFKDLMTTYDTAIKQLSIKTGDLIKDLENQEAIVVIQSKKVEDLRKRYEELAKAFGTTSEETVKARKAFEDAKVELESMANSIEQTQQKIAEDINKFQKTVIDALKERYAQQFKVAEEALKKELESLEEWKSQTESHINSVYDTKIKAIEESSKAQIKAIEDELKALDEAEKQKDREEKDQEDIKKINKLKESIKFEHNDFNREQLEKELNKAIADRQRRLDKEALEDKKANLKTQIDNIKANAEKQKEQLQLEKQTQLEHMNQLYQAQKLDYENRLNDLKKFYEEKTKEANLQAEAERMIMQKSQDDIIQLLHSYGKDYEVAGQTLGERLVAGFKPKIEELKNMIASINDSISSARDNALSVASMASSTSNVTNNNNNKAVTYNVKIEGGNDYSNIERSQEALLRKLAFEIG